MNNTLNTLQLYSALKSCHGKAVRRRLVVIVLVRPPIRIRQLNEEKRCGDAAVPIRAEKFCVGNYLSVALRCPYSSGLRDAHKYL